VITPDRPDRQYSTRLRTALVLTGTGTAGAYHAGVLRALHEAGVRIDLIAGRGVGALGAMFAAVDGGQRLWGSEGLWKHEVIRSAYGWRTPLRVAGWALVAACGLMAVPLALLAIGVIVAAAGALLWLLSLTGASTLFTTAYARSIDWQRHSRSRWSARRGGGDCAVAASGGWWGRRCRTGRSSIRHPWSCGT
jgi:hypothetical protein